MNIVNNPEGSLFIDKPLLHFFELVSSGEYRPYLVNDKETLNKKFKSLTKVSIKMNKSENKYDFDLSSDIFLLSEYEGPANIIVSGINPEIDSLDNFQIEINPKEELFNIDITPYCGSITSDLGKFYNEKWFLYHDAYKIEEKRVRRKIAKALELSTSVKDFGFEVSKVINKAFDIIDDFTLLGKEQNYSNNSNLYEPNNLIVKNGKIYLDFLLNDFFYKYRDYLFKGDKNRIINKIEIENNRHKAVHNSFNEKIKNFKTRSTFNWKKTKEQREELLKLLIKNEFIFSTTTSKQFEIWFSGNKPKFVKRITWKCKSSKNKMPNKKALCYLIKLLIDNRLIDQINEPPNTKHKNFMALIGNTFVDADNKSMTITNANLKGCEVNEHSLLLEEIINKISTNQNI